MRGNEALGLEYCLMNVCDDIILACGNVVHCNLACRLCHSLQAALSLSGESLSFCGWLEGEDELPYIT